MEIKFEDVYFPIIQEYAIQYQNQRRAAMRAKKLVDTGASQNELEFKIEQEGNQAIYRLVLFFKYYSQFYNIQNVNAKGPSKEEFGRFVGWVERNKNKLYVQKTVNSAKVKAPIVTATDLKRVAFKLARSRAKKAWKRRLWKDQPSTQELKSLLDRLAQATLEITIESITSFGQQLANQNS